jgi:hypothetical protein
VARSYQRRLRCLFCSNRQLRSNHHFRSSRCIAGTAVFPVCGRSLRGKGIGQSANSKSIGMGERLFPRKAVNGRAQMRRGSVERLLFDPHRKRGLLLRCVQTHDSSQRFFGPCGPSCLIASPDVANSSRNLKSIPLKKFDRNSLPMSAFSLLDLFSPHSNDFIRQP